ncbi:hypothetical protein EJ02DRAFT_157013 [Clathrospora elynae]|uniref:Uncharacterized protein n=1 Tax=Clathrospora elynae TaxID=706981 RepID=A0A6A5SW63_9PLEO|nr:hypothetical protein EJ02DRAFT_157013 [Clathrospora elynae]
MTNWFGSLQLAYKYIVVFLALLAITILGGFVKLFFIRRKLTKDKATELEAAGAKEDTVELNQREKDEGDLFGIRAIEAGFYAGVAQSRPTSRAGSVIGQSSMSTSTLVGANPSSPLMKGYSNNNSVLSLQLNAGQDAGAPPRASTPSGTKLRPSEAELNGRRNHNGTVDMSLQVPPSPGHPYGQPSDTYGSDDLISQRSVSPADLNEEHYAPAPTPKAHQASYHAADDSTPKSQAASFNNSRNQSPVPGSASAPPTTRLPTIPGTALRKESRSPSPEYNAPRVQVHQPNSEPATSSSIPTFQIQPTAYSPTTTQHRQHNRDESDASSRYSGGGNNRHSTFQAYQAFQTHEDRSTSAASKASTESYNYNLSSSDGSGRTSVLLSSDKASSDTESRPSHVSALLVPGQLAAKDARLSEFYDAYYRNSQIGVPMPVGGETKPVERQSTIVEVDSPLPSPMFKTTPPAGHPGAAF